MTYSDPRTIGDYIAIWLTARKRPSAVGPAEYRRAIKGLL
jgi:hypothetical protein